MFDFSEDEFPKCELEEKKKQILANINEIRTLETLLKKIPSTKKNSFSRGRIIVKMSQLIQDLNIRSNLKEKIIKNLRGKLRDINNLEKTIEDLKLMLKKTRSKKKK